MIIAHSEPVRVLGMKQAQISCGRVFSCSDLTRWTFRLGSKVEFARERIAVWGVSLDVQRVDQYECTRAGARPNHHSFYVAEQPLLLVCSRFAGHACRY